MRAPDARLSRTVVVLGIVSLLTDLSSEMIYPLLPVLLAGSLGAGATALGMVEGAAEAVASLLKVASGKLADRAPRRKPLVVLGYTISGAARPLIGIAAIWPVVLALRVMDRVGKGLRTAPRDALIADVTADGARGRAYGFHRAMDNAGAVFGPLVAVALLGLGLSLRQVFLWAAAPAVLVVGVLVVGVRESPRAVEQPGTARQRSDLAELGSTYRRFLLVVVVFTLGNSSDAFLLLRLHEAGLSATAIALSWAAHSAVRSGAVYFGGRVADRVEHRKLLGLGYVAYALVYVAMSLVESRAGLVLLLVVYGLYYGAVEPTERALVASYAPPGLRGAAFGWFHGAVGASALPASALFGWLWLEVGPAAAFGIGAALAGVAAIALLYWVPTDPRPLPRVSLRE